ncbi:MAG: 2-succinyl-5-enolpyruvyl-6-hydroxy-3-cyclohexene-1-carboxylic-acid synthase [Bacteroidales bacterium]|nr:2-succinyl-5-enolpyruvyl-6-hydroxy-3-cyclohexene-1-carboxylic-acid synthase [Bacteroidales bacterium]
MITSANQVCARVVSVLGQCGRVGHAVLSPGSRDVPLLVAFDNCQTIDCRVVIDERSAAFVGLGIADATGRPVAIVCTSGTAPLNYAPALAEAYYRNVPLIAVTADRPAEWIDQDDSQTIRQPGIFSNFVKATYDLPVGASLRYVDRMLHDAVATALTHPQGPVHINVQVDNPDGKTVEVSDDCQCRPVHRRDFSGLPVPEPAVAELARLVADGKKVLIVAGYMPRDPAMDNALGRLLDNANVVVVAESGANLRLGNIIYNVEPTIAAVSGNDFARPDVVVTIGGSIVSGVLKKWLRDLPGVRLYCIKETAAAIDCYGQDYCHVQSTASSFLDRLAVMSHGNVTSDYRRIWLDASSVAAARRDDYKRSAQWSAMVAVSTLIDMLPDDINLQLSNGMAVRYAAMSDCRRFATVSCNRGVSGIDGSTSTAIGFASVARSQTVFVTGDMSCQYDIGAFGLNFIPDDFKIVVLNNGGGGIFKYIKATRDIVEGPRWYDAPMNLPIEGLSGAYGFNYFSAASTAELEAVFAGFMSAPGAILEIVTDAVTDVRVLNDFYRKTTKK